MAEDAVRSEERSIGTIPIEEVYQGEFNHREIKRGDPTIKELAKSIKAVGLLYPILVRYRKTKEGEYELLAGARRLAAVKLLKKESCLAEVVELDDTKAGSVSIIENMQREDIDPMREAEAISTLLEQGKDTDEVAFLLGRSRTWVARRARIAKLSTAWVKARNSKNHGVSEWPITHLEQIARYDEEVQGAIYERFFGGQSKYYQRTCGFWDAETINQHLGEIRHELGKAPWKLGDEALHPKAGSCENCEKRSDRQPDLFDDEEVKSKKPKGITATCLDFTCWAEKARRYSRGREAKLREGHPGLVKVSAEYNVCPTDAIKLYYYDKVKKGTANAKPALIVAGPGIGKLIWIKTNKISGSSSNQTRIPGVPSSLKVRREKLIHRRQAYVIGELEKKLEAFIEPSVLVNVVLITYFGINNSLVPQNDRKVKWQTFHEVMLSLDEFEKAEEAEYAAKLWRLLQPELIATLSLYNGLRSVPEVWPIAQEVAKYLSVNLAELEEMAEKDIPEPKSWANLKADGTPKKAPAKKIKPKKVVSKKTTAKKKTEKESRRKSFMRDKYLSPELARVIGGKPRPRTSVTKDIWLYIKKNKLQGQKGKPKGMIYPAGEIEAILGSDPISMFEMTPLIAKHLFDKPQPGVCVKCGYARGDEPLRTWQDDSLTLCSVCPKPRKKAS